MGLFSRFWVKRAAKRYARELGPCLRHDFGASEFYSSPQIQAAVTKLRLDRKYIALAYAPFLSEQAFAELANSMPVAVPYDDAKALFELFAPSMPTSASANPETNIYMLTKGVPPT